ncbi:hypothetical protein AB0D10_25395 [Kitasatospora sp. NPDC048545]|uniref:hypothetical protein n=1 Tax=Kitasatospora sp. NPDC048545 TaxID=3157208 RepID=UPI0033C169A1
MTNDDVADATRMIAMALGRGRVPARSSEYARLVQRYHRDPDYAHMVHMAAKGFDLTVLGVDHRSGLILGTTAESSLSLSVTELVPNTGDRPLYLLAQLAIATLAFPRPQDLDDDEFVGRVTVSAVDDYVREHALAIEQRINAAGEDQDPPTGQPGLEALWRAYLRRSATGRTKGDNEPFGSSRKIVERALKHLVDYGFMHKVPGDGEGTYVTHVKYRVQIRELAAGEMLKELAALGISRLPSSDLGHKTGDPAPPTPGAPGPTPAATLAD